MNRMMMIMPNGLLSFHIIEGNLNSEKYEYILLKSVIPITKLNLGNNFYFQQDNARPHVAKNIQILIKNEDMKVLN